LRDVVLLLIAAALASELLLRLPLLGQVRHLLTATRKSAATIRSSRISDHWKERVLPAYSLRMGLHSVLFFLLLCLVASPVVAMGLAASDGMGGWLGLLMRPWAIALLCAASVLYVVARVRLRRG
jgi:hypothetical protein